MTLDRAILHAQEKAKTEHGLCAQEHTQLANWLLELKELREKFSTIPEIVLKEPVSRDQLEKLAVETKVSFEPDNEILYGQDFSIWRGIDSGIIFEVDEHLIGSGVWLKAPGYGGSPYGCGRIVIYYNQDMLKKTG